MKLLSNKFGLVLAIAGLAVLGYEEVRAEDWKFYAIGGDGTFWWYDTQGVTYHPNKIIKVWVKKVKDEEILEMVKSGAKLRLPELEQMTSEKSYERSLVEIDCVKKTYNYLERLNYDSKGVLKSGVVESNIKSILPNSVVGTLYEELCK